MKLEIPDICLKIKQIVKDTDSIGSWVSAFIIETKNENDKISSEELFECYRLVWCKGKSDITRKQFGMRMSDFFVRKKISKIFYIGIMYKRDYNKKHGIKEESGTIY